MNTPYDPTKFYVTDCTGEKVNVKSLTTHEAEQQICKLLTLIREVQIAQLVAADSINRKLQTAGIEIIQ